MIRTWIKTMVSRWLKRPLFIVLTLLLPMSLLLLSSFNQEISLNIGVYLTDDDIENQNILEELSLDQEVFHVTRYPSKDRLEQAFIQEKIVCGFEINSGWIDKIQNDQMDDLFVSYKKTDDWLQPICNEKFIASLLQVYSQYLVEDTLLQQNVSQEIIDKAHQLYPSYNQNEMTFSFDFITYDNGTSYLFPMRQILIFWLFLVGALAVFDYQRLKEQQVFARQIPMFWQRWLVIGLPILWVGLINLVVLSFSSTQWWGEVQFFVISVLWSFVLALILNVLFKKSSWLMSGVTILVLMNLIVLPIWINLSSLVSWFTFVQRIYPWYWIYGFLGKEPYYFLMMIFFSVVMLIFDRIFVKL